MRIQLNKFKKMFLGIIGIIALGFGPTIGAVYAEEGYYGVSMSPLNQKIILNAGEKYTGSFTITNPKNNIADYKYKVSVEPFYVDDDYRIYYETTENYNQIVNWTTTDIKSGNLALGDSQKISFTIDVPKDAPAGGQYVAIKVSSVLDADTKVDSGNSVGLNVDQSVGMAQIIYAEIAGTTKRSGEIISTNMPGFLFSGEITGESTIKNTGNTHGTAKYTLQVYPLFSGEEIYTNEEDPDTKTILPDRVLTNKTAWKETPGVGIFNVVYTVEFEGMTTQVTKLVVKCPLWLLLVIIIVIVAIVIALVVRIRVVKKYRTTEG